MTATLTDRLARTVMAFYGTNDAQIVAAVKEANKLLADHGLTWEQAVTEKLPHCITPPWDGNSTIIDRSPVKSTGPKRKPKRKRYSGPSRAKKWKVVGQEKLRRQIAMCLDHEDELTDWESDFMRSVGEVEHFSRRQIHIIERTTKRVERQIREVA